MLGAITVGAARRRRARRGLDRGRRLRGRSRPRLRGQRARRALRRRGLPAGSAPTSSTCRPTTCSTAQGRRPTSSGTSPTRCRSTAGRSSAGEREAGPPDRRTIVRTSWVVRRARRQHGEDDPAPGRRARALAFVDDQRGHPTFAADLAPMLRRLVDRPRPGVHHVTNQGAVSWFEFAADVLAAGRARSGAGAADHDRRARPAPPGAPARPTRCSTTPCCAWRPPAPSRLPCAAGSRRGGDPATGGATDAGRWLGQ